MVQSDTSKAVQAALSDERSVVFPLSKPVFQGTEQITELKFRELAPADIERIGYPFVFRGQDMRLDVTTIMQYASLLASVPPSVLKSMSKKDFNAMVALVGSFFDDGD